MSELTAWQESNRLAKRQASEVALQKAVTRRAMCLHEAMVNGYSREEAERIAGTSIFGPRARAMVDELLADLLA